QTRDAAARRRPGRAEATRATRAAVWTTSHCHDARWRGLEDRAKWGAVNCLSHHSPFHRPEPSSRIAHHAVPPTLALHPTQGTRLVPNPLVGIRPWGEPADTASGKQPRRLPAAA